MVLHRIPGLLPVAVFGMVSLCLSPVWAQDQPGGGEPKADDVIRSIDWNVGPTKVKIGDQGQMEIPDGFVFTGGDGTRKMLTLMHNPTDGSELGLLTPKDMDWFLIFDFMDIGYIKDAENEELDGDEILDNIKEGNEAANEERKKRGWSEITIVGWQTAPFYDKETNNLKWCIEGQSQGHKIVNFNTRILGRHGVMSANLLVDPAKLQATLPTIKKLLDKFSFTEGKKYSEFKEGDKIAKYGLAALVAVGAGAAAAKLGVLAWIAAKMGKLWKVVILGIIALGAGIKKFLFGGKSAEQPVARPEAVARKEEEESLDESEDSSGSPESNDPQDPADPRAPRG